MRPQAVEYPISKNQIKTLHTLKAKLGIDDDNYRTILTAYGVKSSIDLRFTQAGELISLLSARLNGKRNNLPPRYYGKGERDSLNNKNLTPLQAKRISILEKILGWDEKHTLNFIFQQTGQNSAVQMLTIANAGKVIVGMAKALSWSLRIDYKTLNKMTNEELERKYKC